MIPDETESNPITELAPVGEVFTNEVTLEESQQIDDFPPAEFRATVLKEWQWVLKWWVGLVTILTVPIPIFVLLVGLGIMSVPNNVLITYLSVATGGNTLLAIVGGYLLKLFMVLHPSAPA